MNGEKETILALAKLSTDSKIDRLQKLIRDEWGERNNIGTGKTEY